jgi:ribose transport system ATP-binding protein
VSDNAALPDEPGAALVTMTGISKRFAGVQACAGVDLSVRAGEVRALLGENGAGKSTLMNVLAGVITDHEGTIRIADRPVRFRSPADAQAAGIAMIHQELDLVPGLSSSSWRSRRRCARTRTRKRPFGVHSRARKRPFGVHSRARKRPFGRPTPACW